MGSMHVAGMSVQPPKTLDGFEVLDACHRQTLTMLERLEMLVTQLDRVGGADAQLRTMAAEIVEFFSTTARLHHEDEEKHVFPRLVESGDADTVQAVLRLRQDHGWLEEDWRELAPMLDAVANGQTWYDVETLRLGAEVFTRLSHDHMALEESYIYPQVRCEVPLSERRAMGREMAARRRADRQAR